MKNNTKNKIFLVTLGVLLGFSVLIFTNYQGNLKNYNRSNLDTPNLSQDIYTIANVSGHVWSPNGNKLAYMKCPNLEQFNCELWVADKDPSSAELINHQLISDEAEYNGLLDWKDDWILYRIRREQGTPSSYYGRNELWKIRYDGTGMTQVTFTETNGIRTTWSNPAYTNRGTAVWGRFIPGTNLVYFHAHNGNGWYRTYVCNDDGTDMWYGISAPDYTWRPGLSPTGNKLLWGAQSDFGQPTTHKCSNVDGSGTSTIKAFSSVIAMQTLADGNTVVWTENDNIYAIDMDGTNERTVLADVYINRVYNYNPSEVQGLIMGSDRTDGNMHIYKINVDGTGLEQLTDGPYLDEISALSPDGQYLSYLRLPYDFDKGSATRPYPYELVVKNLYPITPSIVFFDDFESGLSKWQSITGLWHLTDTGSAWPDPCHSPTHSMWFGQEATGNYDTGFQEYGDLISVPFSLAGLTEATLEFYHWREGEGYGWDESFVYISIDGINWVLLYQTDATYIAPWQLVSLDITAYVGNPSVQLRFYFDTYDSVANNYRGWLVDDIQVLGNPSEHDLIVSLETPMNPEIGNSYIINATVINNGMNDENDVDLFLYLDGLIVESTTISVLPVGANETISYMWEPTEYTSYNFTAYAPPVPDELLTNNNFLTKMIYISEFMIFDGMYIAHNTTEYVMSDWYGNVTYSQLSANLFNVVWLFDGSPLYTWQEDSSTREITGSTLFPDYTHTPFWIFTEVSLGDFILISSIWDADHTFEIIDELVYDLPGFGLIEVWVLQDLAYDNCTALYEKSTGILLNGTFYYSGGYNYLIFEFDDTNVEFSLYEPRSLTINSPDSSSSWETSTSESITWASTGTITNVKLELYLEDVFVMDIIPSTPNDGEFVWEIPSTLADSDQYQIKIIDASDPSIYDYSDYFEIYTARTITVTTPDSSSSWETGTFESVYWTSTGTITNVKLELYLEDVFVMDIIPSTLNDGEFVWEIPSTLVDSDQYQIKIIDASDPSIYDYSDYFEIERPPSGEPAIPGYNLYILVGIASVISIILFIKRLKK